MEKARKTSYETEIDYSMQALEAKDELQMEVQLYKKNGELNFEILVHLSTTLVNCKRGDFKVGLLYPGVTML